jgi:hypothetical protein
MGVVPTAGVICERLVMTTTRTNRLRWRHMEAVYSLVEVKSESFRVE